MKTLMLLAMLQVPPADSVRASAVITLPTQPVTVEVVEGAHYLTPEIHLDASIIRLSIQAAVDSAVAALAVGGPPPEPPEHWAIRAVKYAAVISFAGWIGYSLHRIAGKDDSVEVDVDVHDDFRRQE